MINNNRQQQNGRRRGRGGQRQGGGGNQGNGSRIDNRARGNAVQLLEKYKSLAADAQRQGDRVNTEYYLQFADHYFRVVSEQRGRIEEQNQPRRDGQGNFDPQFDGEEDDDGDDQSGNAQPYAQQGQQSYGQPGGGDQRDAQAQRDQQAQPRDGNRDRDQRDGNRDQPRRFDAERDGNREPRRDRVQRDRPAAETPAEGVPALEGEPIAASEQQPRPRRARSPRSEPAAPADTFDADRLPPSFAPAPANDGGEPAEDGEAKPRRRRLRPVSDAG